MAIGNEWLGSISMVTVTQGQNLATNSFNMGTVVYSVPAVVDRVTVKVAVQATETLSISLVPYVGTAYSTILFAASTSGHTSFFWQPDRPMYLYPGDVLNVNVSNGNLTGQIYGTILALS